MIDPAIGMATTHISSPPALGLLTIPGEIRNIIYRMLLTKPYAYQQKADEYAPLHPAILQTNRQINEEATNILHGENIWIIAKIDTIWPLIASGVSIVSWKDASNIKFPALHIDFAMPTSAEKPQSHITLIMGEEGIQYFLRALWNSSSNANTKEAFKASWLHLALCETPFHTQSKLQSVCLQPFGLVRGLRGVNIRGQVETACINEILYRPESSIEAMAQIHSVSQAYLDKRDEAYFAGEPQRACAQYAHGSAFLKHMCSHVLKGAARRPFNVLACALSSHYARAVLACGLYKKARKFGKELLESAHVLRSIARVHVELCTARAHRALGEGEDESRLFESALNASDDNSTVMIALAELFPNAAPEQVALLVEQQGILQRVEGVDVDVIRAFWEAV